MRRAACPSRGPRLISIDTSSFVASLSGAAGWDVEAVAIALEHAQVTLPPVVLTELRSDPEVSESVKDLFMQLPVLVSRVLL